MSYFSVESEIKEIVLKDCESGHVSGGFAGGGEIHSGPPPFLEVGKMRKINMTPLHLCKCRASVMRVGIMSNRPYD